MGKLFQREVLKQIFCPEDTQIDDEFTTWKTYLQTSKIVYLDDEDYIYRLNQEGLSHRKNQEDIRPLRSLEEITFLHILGYDPRILEKIYIKRLKRCRKAYLNAGMYHEYQDVDFKLRMIAKNKP